jgi:hypothetical protein
MMKSMRMLSKILSTQISLRSILLAAAIISIAVEMDFDGFIYNKLDINYPSYIDPELEPYYDRYRELESLSNQTPSHRSLILVMSSAFKKDSTVLAYCDYHNEFNVQIVVNATKWVDLPHPERETLLTHEIGHCLFKKEHKTGTIMESRLLFHGYYLAFYDKLLKEFFNIKSEDVVFTYKEY